MPPGSSLTDRLAAWAARLDHDALPADVTAGMMEGILDTVGVRLAGARTDFARLLADALEIRPLAGLNWADPKIAFFNAASSSCLDFDDTHERTLIHPTAPALFAALGAAAGMHRTGRELVTAVAAGVEIACRIAGAAPSAFHARGFHPTGIIGVFGAAAAAAIVLDPRPEKIRNALGFAGSFGAGLMQPFIDGSDQRYLHSGNAAASGLLAARLANAGMEGSQAVLEGRSGLFSSHVPDAAPFDFAAVLADIGERWECRSVLLKRYPTGFVTHPYIDAVLGLANIHEIEKLVCIVPPAAVGLVCEPRLEKLTPKSAAMARVSLPHMLAEAMIYGAIDAESFSSERLADPRVRELAPRIDYAVADQDAWGPERLIITRHGHPSEVIAVGARPLSRAEVVRKFVANAGPQWQPIEAAHAAERLLRLDDAANALDLILPILGESERQIR